MTEVRHSPGPWHLAGPNNPDDEAIGIESADGWTVADVFGDAPDLAPHMTANARLIKAAPKMLTALDEAFNALAFCATPGGGCDDAQALAEAKKTIRAAIEEATGQ